MQLIWMKGAFAVLYIYDYDIKKYVVKLIH